MEGDDMDPLPNDPAPKASIEDRRLSLEEKRFRLHSSFARKWLPTIATAMVGLIASGFGFMQHLNSIASAAQATERANLEATSKNEREWGFKVVDMYFSKRELFDLTKNREQAALNLEVLSSVAPKAVQGVLNAERSRIPAPTGIDDASRLDSLAAVADVQNSIAQAMSKPRTDSGEITFKPSDFTVHIQFPENSREIALAIQAKLSALGYRAPGIEKVTKAPSRLQVRYYRPEQKSFAQNLALKLGKDLGLVSSLDSAILVTSAKQLPSGIMEIWLPQNSG
jgi:hypothetical protein